MKNCTDIHYKKLLTAEKDLPTAIDTLLSQIPEDWATARIIYFVNADSDAEYFGTKRAIEERMHRHFGSRCPACTVVAQAPLEGALQAEVHYLTGDSAKALKYKTSSTGRPYTAIDTDEYRYLFTGAQQAQTADASVADQAETAFETLQDILKSEGMELARIVRQWNYICQITKADDCDGQHYQQFNNARSRHYSNAKWENGYPAATGIGTAYGSVILDADAMMAKSPEATTQPIDNKLQIAAHEYSGDVLAKLKSGSTTPKFERARKVCHHGDRLIYVSGTASIRGERTIGVGDVEKQCRYTVENIRQLTADTLPQLCRIYLKNGSDYAAAKRIIDQEYPGTESIYIVADVCRDDLLIEIEGVWGAKAGTQEA